MADTQETIADIIREKRLRADEIERDVAEKMKRGEMVSDCYARELVADIRREADRLEAALGRERGDCAKLREALEATLDLLWDMQNRDRSPISNQAYAVKSKIKSALAAPPRNCDLPEVAKGHPKLVEQAWRVFKRSHKDSHLDSYGLLRCIRWLLAPATEKEGAAK